MKSFKEIKEHGRIVVLKDGVDGFKGEIHMPRWTGTIIASNGAGWNHVSVAPYKRSIIPTWEDIDTPFWKKADMEEVLTYSVTEKGKRWISDILKINIK